MDEDWQNEVLADAYEFWEKEQGTNMKNEILRDFENEMIEGHKRVIKSKEKEMSEKLYFIFYVAGVKFRKDWKKNLEEFKIDDELTLVPEPTNKFDPFAIKVYSTSNVHLGYVPAKTGEAKEISNALNEGRLFTTKVSDLNPDFEPWRALEVEVKEV